MGYQLQSSDMKMRLLTLLLLSISGQSLGSNILVLAPLGSWSEYQLIRAVTDTLAEVGHNVTLVSGFQSHKKNSIKEIFIGSSEMEDQNIFEVDTMDTVSFIYDSQHNTIDMMFTNEQVLDLWEHRNDFDAIIAPSAINEVISPFLIDYHGAYIGICAVGIETGQLDYQGNWLPRSVAPSILLNYDDNMNFLERVLNLIMEFVIYMEYLYDSIPNLQSHLEKYFPGMPPILTLYGNFSVLLINSHFAMDGNYPLLPNQVEIGTLAARLPLPLDKDLQEVVDGAEDGVIYFSLGSLAKSTDIPKKQLAMLLEAFGHLHQRVVWKFENSSIENLPSNVIIRKWLPQQDILGHPKTLLFISHCGNFGTQEAMFHGVPVLGVPVSFDQHRNAARLARKGYGEVLNWEDMTVQSIIDNINILIKDKSYQERIKVVSAALQDQMESPKERAVWWIEYAIRHKDAPHLHYAGKSLNVLLYHMIDVWAFLVLLLLLWTSLTFWCLRKCWRKHFSNKTKQE